MKSYNYFYNIMGVADHEKAWHFLNGYPLQVEIFDFLTSFLEGGISISNNIGNISEIGSTLYKILLQILSLTPVFS